MRTTLTRTWLKKDFPLCFAEFIKHGGDSFPNLDSALDSLLFKFGMGMIAPAIYAGDTERILGHESYMIFYPNNVMKEEARKDLVIQDFKNFKNLDKAKRVTYLACLEHLEQFLRRRLDS